MTKKNKPFFIFDRNDFINEDLRDDLPPYMQDQVKGTWGEEYLDLDASEKAVEIPDQRVKLSWGDINAEKEEILLSLSGSITENLLGELLEDLNKLTKTLEYYDNLMYIDNEMVIEGMNLFTEVNETVRELKRDKMYNSPESAEDHLEHIIKLIYDNNMRSIDFNKTEFDEEKGTLQFYTYDNRATNFPKYLNKLHKYSQQLIDGKKEVNTEDYNVDLVQEQADIIRRVVNSVNQSVGSGALKSIIKNVVKQVDEIRSGNIYPELLISSDAEDFMRMSISPFYASCMNLYDGTHRKQLLSNVFDKNSKILYVIINKEFEDCRGNKHPYTPIIRSVIRKLNDEQYALDAIYKPNTLEVSIDDLIRMMNNKLDTAWFNEDILGGTYEVEYDVQSEEIYRLPSTYSDRFTVAGEGQLLTTIQNLDEDGALDLIEERMGYKPEKIMQDYVIFHDRSLSDTVYGLDDNPIKNLYYFFKDDSIDEELELNDIFPLVQHYLSENKYVAMQLYEYLNRVMRDEILKFRESLGRRIDPQTDLLTFFETYSLDGNIRELERTVRRELKNFELDEEKKRVIYKYIGYLVRYGEIEEMGARLEVDWNESEDDIFLSEGVDENSIALLEGHYSDEEIISRLYDRGFIDIHELETMDIDSNMEKGISDFLRSNYTSDLDFIELLHSIAEEGIEPDIYFNEIETALNIYLK